MITFTSTFGSVSLPNPLLGDSEQLNVFTSFQLTMSGEIRSFKKTGTHSRFLVTFINLSQLEYLALKAFIEGSSGLLMTYTDYNSTVFNGVLINNPFEITPNARRQCTGVEADCAADNKEVATTRLEFQAVN